MAPDLRSLLGLRSLVALMKYGLEPSNHHHLQLLDQLGLGYSQVLSSGNMLILF